MRGLFLWRAGAAFLLLLLLGGAGCATMLWLLGALGRSGAGTVPPWVVLLLGLSMIAGVTRSLRILALPLRDLIDAAERVEAGDLSAGVRVRGPRELRSLARAFNAMLERLRSNEAQRRRLLADVTHELRTPVAVIQGNLEAILDGVYPPDGDHLEPVLEETRVLSRLIDDLRTLSLAESGVLELHREPTDLGVLAGEVVSTFRGQAETAGIALLAEVPGETPLVVVDPLRIREVLANLTANALRHTPPAGMVRISAVVEPAGRRVVLSVTDTGTGIPLEDLPYIFDRFYKSNDSTGSGLGLAIAKNLVEAHGGEIHAESTPGGTTLRCILPVDHPEE
jgi:signal transduction histidine kinase